MKNYQDYGIFMFVWLTKRCPCKLCCLDFKLYMKTRLQHLFGIWFQRIIVHHPETKITQKSLCLGPVQCLNCFDCPLYKKVQVRKDQEKAQSEKDSHLI